ncbi:helix-turn-helix domain-containing protein [Sphingorhabdus sp. EL138]|uniref:helix-turn-helix domain-containing protein n=1 Tax=Sphingorhabdus sp. EL138 TaxID=2073156 RepID=UPI0013A58067|nr:AraC family transcriptional regulator [Sphingorhabdus sp. EL138]
MASTAFSTASIESVLVEAAALLIFNALRVISQRAESSIPITNSTKQEKLRKTVGRIEDNLGEHISLKGPSSITGLSEWHYLRQFKELFGRSPHQYVQERRLTKSQRLLRETMLQICQISFEYLFSSQSHMTTAFEKHFGITPKV